MATYGDFKDQFQEGTFFRSTGINGEQRHLNRVVRRMDDGFVFEGIYYTPAYVTKPLEFCRPEQISSDGHQYRAFWNDRLKFLAFGKTSDMRREEVVNVLGECEERTQIRAQIASLEQEIEENREQEASCLPDVARAAAVKAHRLTLMRQKRNLQDSLSSVSPFVPDASESQGQSL